MMSGMPHIPQRFSRFLVIVALLFVCGTQALEVSHSHAVDDSTVNCLLCNGAASGTLACSPQPSILKAVPDRIALAEFLPPLVSPEYRPAPRGPPLDF